MAELSVEEAQRLSRQFLTGAASVADVQRLQADLNDDLALELLAQIQTALDDVAPAGLSLDQARSVDSRVEALVLPRIKRSGPFGWLKKLFKPKPKAEAEEAPARRSKFKSSSASPAQASAAPPLAVEELPAPSAMDGDGLEEMAPISAVPAPTPAAGPAPKPEPQLEAEGQPEPKRGPAWSAAIKSKRWAILVAIIAVLLLLAIGWYLWQRPKAEPVAEPLPIATPAPTVQPTPLSRTPQRGRNLSQPKQEPLPAQLPATTPQPAGQLQ